MKPPVAGIRVTATEDQWKRMHQGLTGSGQPIVDKARTVIGAMLSGQFDQRSGRDRFGDLWIEAVPEAWYVVLSHLAQVGVNGEPIRKVLQAVEATAAAERKEREQPRKLCDCQPGQCVGRIPVNKACRRALQLQVGEV